MRLLLGLFVGTVLLAQTKLDWAQIKNGTFYGVPRLVADGVTNDAPAIQAAIDSLAAGKGGIIALPPGNILLSCSGCQALLTFHGPATVSLQGAGWNLNGGTYSNTTLVVAAAVANTVDVIRIRPGTSTYGITGMTIRDLGIISQNGATSGRNGISIEPTVTVVGDNRGYIKNLTIDNIYIGILPGRGIVCPNTVVVEGFYRSVIQNSWIYGGMKFDKLGDSVHIWNNDIWGPSIGIQVTSIDPGAAHLDIWQNVITTGAAFLYLGSAAAFTTIRDNFFEAQVAMAGSNGAAIDIDCAGNPCYSTQFTGNSINLAAFSVTLKGLRINNAIDTVLRDNEFVRTPSTGGVDWFTTSSAVDTYVGKQYYSPNTDVYPTTWTDAGTSTTVEPRCEVYTVSGASLTSATNTQQFNLFVHPANWVVTGVRTNVVTGFTASNLTGLVIEVGDVCCAANYYASSHSVTSTGIHRTIPPTNATGDGGGTVLVALTGTYSAGGNFSTNPVTGSVEVSVCWGLQPMTGQN